jgi:hypothetical protein
MATAPRPISEIVLPSSFDLDRLQMLGQLENVDRVTDHMLGEPGDADVSLVGVLGHALMPHAGRAARRPAGAHACAE